MSDLCFEINDDVMEMNEVDSFRDLLHGIVEALAQKFSLIVELEN